jgi:hypothetical protein
MKNHGFTGNYDMVMNLAQAMLSGHGLEAFLSELRDQDIKNKTRTANEQTEYTPHQIYDCAIFGLAIRTFDIQSGWRDAFERQRECTRRDIFMGKLNPEKFIQRLQYEPFSSWQGALTVQRFGRPAEHVPSAVASRSAEADHCKYDWKYAR